MKRNRKIVLRNRNIFLLCVGSAFWCAGAEGQEERTGIGSGGMNIMISGWGICVIRIPTGQKLLPRGDMRVGMEMNDHTIPED